MRLIDADALKAEWYRLNDINEEDCGARFVGYQEIARLINNAPTVSGHGDLISRADALRELNGACSNWKDDCKVAEIINALPSAEAVPKSDQYKKGFEDAKRSFLIEYARESENMRKRNAQLEVMLNAQKAISADAVQGWIPCGERLPSECEVVLASWSCLWKDAIVLARRYEGKWEWAYEHGTDYWQPTELEEYWPEAWQPLPAPYKGGELLKAR